MTQKKKKKAQFVYTIYAVKLANTLVILLYSATGLDDLHNSYKIGRSQSISHQYEKLVRRRYFLPLGPIFQACTVFLQKLLVAINRALQRLNELSWQLRKKGQTIVSANKPQRSPFMALISFVKDKNRRVLPRYRTKDKKEKRPQNYWYCQVLLCF